MSDLSARFIGEPVEVVFEKPPLFSKKPPCPDAFIWREQTFAVLSVITEWRNFRRRGRMSSNMRPENLAKAAKRGSWGVGRYYFQIMVGNGRIFELYYDRAPNGQKQRAGSWHLNRELFP